jgi:hypothetical protein
MNGYPNTPAPKPTEGLLTSAASVFTGTFRLYDGWHAMWQGHVARATWMQQGPAEAWVSLCVSTNRFHS